MKIHVNFIPETWIPVWTFPTPHNSIFDKVQTLFWTKVEEDPDPFKDYTDGEHYMLPGFSHDQPEDY